MRARPWSLRRRYALLLCLLSVVPVAVSALVGAQILYHHMDRELRSLLEEEMEEARSEIVGAEDPVSALSHIVPVLAGHHPSVRLGWVLKDADGKAHQLGDEKALGRLGGVRVGAGERKQLDASLWAARLHEPGSVDLTLVMDTSLHAATATRYEVLAIVTVGIALILALLLAQLFARQLAASLSRLTRALRVGQAVELAGLPSELRPIAVQLQENLEAAQATADETRCFVAGLAHELRSPIQNLIGQSEVAMLQGRPVEVYRSMISSQLEEMHELASAVDNLIQLCAAREPASILRHETLDLRSELEMRLHNERRSGAARGIEILIESRGNTVLRGDRESLLRAIRNVIDNAIKWSPDESRVHVQIDGTVEELVVEVEDSGPGIPRDQRESVFVPFHRGLEAPGSRTGFGLGLAIVRSAAEQHGGSAKVVDSAAGARIRITLPREEVPGVVASSSGRGDGD